MTNADAAHDLDQRIGRIERGLTVPSAPGGTETRTATLTQRMEFYKVPGVSIAVINNYQVEWARAHGVVETGGTAPVTTHTLFQGGSLGKPIVALAALRLVDDGRLRLDSDVNTFLTSWKIPPNDAWQPRVTLRHLLTHTGGLTVPLYPGYPRDHATPTLWQVLEGAPPARTSPVRVGLIPGSQYRYSSGGYVVLQQLLMDVTGQPFAQLMHDLVLGPLGMEHSTFEQPLPESRWHLAATGHRNGGQPVQGKWFVYPEAAQGGLWTTPADVARFVVELQRAKAGLPSRTASRRMATEMLLPQVEDHVGLGIFQEGPVDHPRFGHIGGNEGFSSRLTGFRDTGLGAVVLANWHYGFLIDEIFAAIAKEYAWRSYLPEERRVAKIDETILQGYVGDYEMRPGFRLRIRRVGDALGLEVSGQAPIELYPVSETRFIARVVDAEIAFRSEAGRLTALVVQQADRHLSARKVV
jgi:CubicO group peptidase (beta-lactamase class C family)